jgi:hypothetical protein
MNPNLHRKEEVDGDELSIWLREKLRTNTINCMQRNLYAPNYALYTSLITLPFVCIYYSSKYICFFLLFPTSSPNRSAAAAETDQSSRKEGRKEGRPKIVWKRCLKENRKGEGDGVGVVGGGRGGGGGEGEGGTEGEGGGGGRGEGLRHIFCLTVWYTVDDWRLLFVSKFEVYILNTVSVPLRLVCLLSSIL